MYTKDTNILFNTQFILNLTNILFNMQFISNFKTGLTNAPQAPVYLKLQRQQAEGFGFRLNKEKGDAKHVISEVDVGSVAHTAGLNVGHRVIEVNSINVEYDTHQEVVERIKTRPCKVSLLAVNEQTYDYFSKKNVLIIGRTGNHINNK